MTTTLTEPDQTRPDADDGDLVHFWCCDQNVAMCGADISDEPLVPDASAEEVCTLCRIVDDNRWACPVPGCSP